jgi:hypothetical protein
MGVSGLTGDIAAARITNALNASGSAPIYAARAWVNFNGTGTVAIRASGNVSSITDNGTGDYTVNFTTALPDNNYSFEFGGARDSSGAECYYSAYDNGVLTTSLRVRGWSNSTVTARDTTYFCVSVHR